MREERLEVSVIFDDRHGYVASAPELRWPVLALSLGGLRRKIEIEMLPDDIRVMLQLDGLAERAPPAAGVGATKQNCAALTNGLPSRPMSAPGGSGRTTAKEVVRVCRPILFALFRQPSQPCILNMRILR